MKQMKKFKLSCNVAIILLALSFAGCQTPPTGQSATLINAQTTVKQAKITMLAFAHMERDYEVQLKAIDPKIHTYAETVRANAKQWLQDAWNAVEAYRTTKDESKLNQALAVVKSAAASSQYYMALIKSKGVTPNG